MFRRVFLLSFVVMILLAVPRAAVAQQIATVVQVTGDAEISFDGRRFIIRDGARVAQGATISTTSDATVEMTFDDGTNMVVGPNSSLEVTEILMISGNRAGRFAVNALAGSFRFISGNSDKEAYEISTPSATMGVRGTAFDLAVTRSRTALALFNGEVRICRGGRICARVRGSCAVATTRGFRRISGVSGSDAAALLETAFPLIPDQDRLASPFRVQTRSCDRYVALPKERSPAPSAQQTPQPPAPERPTPQPPTPEPPAPRPPAPEEPSFPGNSGDEGPSQGKGGGQSLGQDGTGTGHGQGAINGKRGENGNKNGNGHGRQSDRVRP